MSQRAVIGLGVLRTAIRLVIGSHSQVHVRVTHRSATLGGRNIRTILVPDVGTAKAVDVADSLTAGFIVASRRVGVAKAAAAVAVAAGEEACVKSLRGTNIVPGVHAAERIE